MNPQYLFVAPAYGRKYKDSNEVEREWLDGKDFKICGGPYMSIRDARALRRDGWDVLAVLYHNGEGKVDKFEVTI